MAAEKFGSVDQKYINRVEAYNKRKFENVGRFCFEYLEDLVNLMSDETSGEIELLVMPHSTLKDGCKASLLVIKSGDEYFALAGRGTYVSGE